MLPWDPTWNNVIGHGAAWLPLRPRPTLDISRRKSHIATSCWAHKQWPLSLADMVWPQLCLPCLANHKSSTFKQLEWWKIDETAAPRSANKNRTGTKSPARSECVRAVNRVVYPGVFTLSHGVEVIRWLQNHNVFELFYCQVQVLFRAGVWRILHWELIDWIGPLHVISLWTGGYRRYGPVNSSHRCISHCSQCVATLGSRQDHIT